VIAVSAWLRDRLETAVPDARGKVEVVDCGVDLERSRRATRSRHAEAGLEAAESFLCLAVSLARKPGRVRSSAGGALAIFGDGLYAAHRGHRGSASRPAGYDEAGDGRLRRRPSAEFCRAFGPRRPRRARLVVAGSVGGPPGS
jgi:hypothetical protein